MELPDRPQAHGGRLKRGQGPASKPRKGRAQGPGPDRPVLGAREATRLRMRMARSLPLLVRACLPEAARVEAPRFHHRIDRSLRDLSLRRYNVVAPRGSAKSTLAAVALVVWHIFFQELGAWLDADPADRPEAPPKRRRKYVVLVSKSQREAIERLDTIKSILEHSRVFRALYGDWGPDTAPKWTEAMVVLKDGTVLKAVGMGQPVRGLNRRGLRPTLLVLDDPEDEENTKTVERMQANARWLFQAVEPSLDNEIGRMVVIGTPQNAQSLVVRLHQSFHGGEERGESSVWFENDLATLSHRYSVSASGDLVLEPGEAVEEDDRGRWVRVPRLLWPEWFDAQKLEEKRHTAETTEGVGIGVYYREYECKVVGDAEQVFKPAYFAETWAGALERDALDAPYVRVTHLRGEALAEPLELPCSVSVGVDPAFSTSPTADRTAVAVLATTHSEARGEEVWELPGVYERLHPTELLGAIWAKHREVRPDRGLMEVTQAQVYVYHDLARTYGVRYVEDRPREKKKGEGSRIARLEPAMNPENRRAPKFWHRPGSPLKGELLAYPRGHDDYADGTEKAYRARRRPLPRQAVVHDADARPPGPPAALYDPMTA